MPSRYGFASATLRIIDAPVTTYRTIVADPPWPYGNGFVSLPGDPRQRGHRVKRKPLPYPSMTLEEIAALPVRDLADRDCRLFLWATNRYLPDAFGVLAAWGFEYKQTLVWHKTGNPSPFGGSIAPNQAEYLLVAVRGRPPLGDRWPRSVLAAPREYQHSRKPDVFLDLIERASPGPYLELFARRARFGWDYWPDQPADGPGTSPRACAGCGRAFAPRRADARYCSNACRQRSYRTRRAAA